MRVSQAPGSVRLIEQPAVFRAVEAMQEQQPLLRLRDKPEAANQFLMRASAQDASDHGKQYR